MASSHAVTRYERHPVQYLPPPVGLPGQRLYEAGQIRPEQVEQRPGEHLRDAAAAVRLGVSSGRQRAMVEALDERDGRVGQQGPEQARDEARIERVDVGVDERDDVARGHG
jgi:hypothetical protein